MSDDKYIPNPAAFPTDSTHGYTRGMELRDYFAAHALAGILRAEEGSDGEPVLNGRAGHEYARQSYVLADAMLAERLKKGGAS